MVGRLGVGGGWIWELLGVKMRAVRSVRVAGRNVIE